MASPVVTALEQALHHGYSQKGQYWVFRHPNPDAPPLTFRVTRRAGNGWTLLLAASKETKEVLNFYVETPEDQAAVNEALKWLGIGGTVQSGEEGPVLKLATNKVIPSQMFGGEKPKKK